MKCVFLLSLLCVCSSSLSQKQFAKIKVGMKDTQVEKMVGLPLEIFRGFAMLEGHNVSIKGQLNYICWRFKTSTSFPLDTSWIFSLREDTIGFRLDTLCMVNGVRYSRNEYAIIEDTVFVQRIGSSRFVLTAEQYREGVKSTFREQFYSFPVEIRGVSIEMVPVTKERRVSSFIEYVLTMNFCILFDPSSNRVVNTGFYPTSVDSKGVKEDPYRFSD